MAFIDTELTLPVVPIETASFNFDTTIAESLNGVERSIARWSEYRLDVTFDILTLNSEELLALQDFYKSVNGNLNSFRYKSLIESSVTATSDNYHLLDDGNNVFSVGQLFQRGSTYQMIKVYRIDRVAEQAGAVSGYKTLKLIVPGTLQVFYNGVRVFNFVLNPLTGQVTLNDVIPANATITFSCEYYHEMRFNMDSLSATKIAPDQYQISGISLIEEVTTALSPLIEDDWRPIPYELLLPFEPSNSNEIELEIKSTDLENGRGKRIIRNETPKLSFNLESNTITETEKGLFLTWFLACKGRLLSFEYKDSQFRFDTDKLSFTPVALEDYRYYSYSMLPLVSTRDVQLLTLDYSLLYGHFSLLENTNNGNWYNYHVYGQNQLTRLGAGESIRALVPSSSSFTSTVYEASGSTDFARHYRSGVIPLDTFNGGVSFIFTATIPTADSDQYFIENPSSPDRGLAMVYKSSLNRWEIDFFGTVQTVVSSGKVVRDQSQSFAVTYAYTGLVNIYVNGKLDATLAFSLPVTAKEANAGLDFRQGSNFFMGNIQIWKKALTQKEINILYPLGKKSFLRSTTPKDSAVGKQLIITPEDNNYGYISNTSGSFSVFTPRNSTNLPSRINNEYFNFQPNQTIQFNNLGSSGDANSYIRRIYLVAAFPPADYGLNFDTPLFDIKDNSPSPRTQRLRILFRFTNGFQTIWLLRNNPIGDIRYVRLFRLPTNFYDGAPKELCFVLDPSGSSLSDGNLYINGVACFVQDTYSIVDASSNLNESRVGSFNTPFQLYLFYPEAFSQGSINPISVSNPYTSQNTEAYQTARAFYQMGFKKSLTTLEPNNPRLLAGDYPI